MSPFVSADTARYLIGIDVHEFFHFLTDRIFVTPISELGLGLGLGLP